MSGRGPRLGSSVDGSQEKGQVGVERCQGNFFLRVSLFIFPIINVVHNFLPFFFAHVSLTPYNSLMISTCLHSRTFPSTLHFSLVFFILCDIFFSIFLSFHLLLFLPQVSPHIFACLYVSLCNSSMFLSLFTCLYIFLTCLDIFSTFLSTLLKFMHMFSHFWRYFPFPSTFSHFANSHLSIFPLIAYMFSASFFFFTCLDVSRYFLFSFSHFWRASIFSLHVFLFIQLPL